MFFLFIRYLYENKKLMAQKFITKKNRHLFRRPVKARIEEKVVIELPVTEEVIETPVITAEVITPEVIETPVITAEIYTPDTTTVPMVDTEVVKKKKPVKKNKEVEEVEIIESENNE